MCPQFDGSVPDKLVNVKLKLFKDSKQPVLPQAEGRTPAHVHKRHVIGQAKTLRPRHWHKHLSELAFKRAQSLLHKVRSYSDQHLGY